MLTRVAHLAGRDVRYLEAGSGRPLVLLHAFPLSAEQWVPQLCRVPPGFRVIAPDLRGFQGTGPAVQAADVTGVTMDDYAADVLALMTHLDIERAVIGGVSMGGYVALALFQAAPARVAGLILANTRAGADSAEGRAARDRMAALAAREGPAGVAREMVPKLLGATTLREQPDLADVVSALIEMNSAEAIIAAILAMKARPDRTSLLASIACPTTIITGDEDVLVPPAEAETMHRAIPGSELITLPRVGHLSNLEGDGSVFHRFA
jgi:pimeloyl-ACP methyl ester carboxylesterase